MLIWKYEFNHISPIINYSLYIYICIIYYSCQTYEGGIGGYPGNEAHGGYTFCALASLEILKKTDYIDSEALMVIIISRIIKLLKIIFC